MLPIAFDFGDSGVFQVLGFGVATAHIPLPPSPKYGLAQSVVPNLRDHVWGYQVRNKIRGTV